MQESIDRTQDEEELQLLAQCVFHHRKAIGHTKEDYEKLDDISYTNTFNLASLNIAPSSFSPITIQVIDFSSWSNIRQSPSLITKIAAVEYRKPFEV